MVGALVVLAACAAPQRSGPQALSPGTSDLDATPSSSSASGTGETAAPTSPPRRRAVTIALAGDVHAEGVLRSRLDDPATAFTGTAFDVLARADVAVVNLETAVGTGGEAEPGKRFVFRAPPTVLTALAAAGVDVVSLANNHVLDFGRGLLTETFGALAEAERGEPPLRAVGVGRDVDEAFRPALIDVGDTRIAMLAATTASLDPTADPTGHWAVTASRPGTADAIRPERLVRAVARARRGADVVVVYVHWGVQGESCPTPHQRDLAARLLDAGADVVAGSHAHRLQGDGPGGDGGYVAYGLGNFAWYLPSSDGEPTGVLSLRVRPTERGQRADVLRARWTPAAIGADGLPRVIGSTGRERFDAQRTRSRDCSDLRTG